MEQAAPLTLLAITAGYLFTRFFHYTAYRSERASGYHLLFQSACWGIVLVALAWSLLALIRRSPFRDEIARGAPQVLSEPILASVGGAFVLSLALPHFFNLLYPRERAARRIIQRYGSELEKLLYRSIESLLPLSISLKNEKVYIGWTTWTPEPRVEIQDLRVLPAMSGHRDPETKKLTLDTQYLKAYELIEAGTLDLEARDFEIVIPLDEFRSANLFSLEVDQSMFEIARA